MKELTPAIQEALIALLCYGEGPGGATYIRGLVPPGVFDPYYNQLAEAAIEYVDRYKKAPGEHTLDLINQLKELHPNDVEVYDNIYISLESIKDGINREYVTAQALQFVRRQRLKRGISQTLDLLAEEQKDSLDKAEHTLRQAMESSLDLFDAGLSIHDPKAFAFLDREREETFPTGIDALDQLQLGPCRKRLHVFLASTGKGKSWWLMNLAKRAMRRRLKVVYVTLELDRDEVMLRMMQSLFAVQKRDAEILKSTIQLDELGRVVGFGKKKVAAKYKFTDDDIRKKLSEKLKGFRGRWNFWVKWFKTGELTVREFEGYLDGLEAKGIIPDLVCIDYADLFQTDPNNLRHSLDDIYKRLRGVAGERNIAIATCSQSNKEGEQSGTVQLYNMAEAWAKAGTADYVITYSQTVDEHALRLARLFVAKGRTDRDRFGVLISQLYDLGQFVMESAMFKHGGSYWDLVAGMKDDHDEDEEEESNEEEGLMGRKSKRAARERIKKKKKKKKRKS